MSVKIKINTRSLNKRVQKATLAALAAAKKVYDKEINRSILRGVSPVDNFGRFPKYSTVYKMQIRGEAFLDPETGEYIIFRTNQQGKRYPVQVPRKNYGALPQFKGKKISPVNLRVTGDLLNSYFSRIRNGKLEIGYDNFLADIHNRQGAGKSKVVRRMLPTNPGEGFNRLITRRVRDAAKAAYVQGFNRG